MNKSKKDHTGQPFRGFVIWDITAFDGYILIGSTILERIALLNELYPSRGELSANGIVYAYKTDVPDIYRAANFEGKFKNIYDSITPVEMIEGFVLKRKNGKLEPCVRELSNMNWGIKVRKPTANYKL